MLKHMQTITVNLRKQLFISSSKDVLHKWRSGAVYVHCSPASRICGETRSTKPDPRQCKGRTMQAQHRQCD